MSFKRCFIIIISIFNYCHGQQNYSLKELNNLLVIEYTTLKSQEKLFAQKHDNENVKKAIQKTITRIKQRIEKLEKEQHQTLSSGHTTTNQLLNTKQKNIEVEQR